MHKHLPVSYVRAAEAKVLWTFQERGLNPETPPPPSAHASGALILNENVTPHKKRFHLQLGAGHRPLSTPSKQAQLHQLRACVD